MSSIVTLWWRCDLERCSLNTTRTEVLLSEDTMISLCQQAASGSLHHSFA